MTLRDGHIQRFAETYVNRQPSVSIGSSNRVVSAVDFSKARGASARLRVGVLLDLVGDDEHDAMDLDFERRLRVTIAIHEVARLGRNAIAPDDRNPPTTVRASRSST